MGETDINDTITNKGKRTHKVQTCILKNMTGSKSENKRKTDFGGEGFEDTFEKAMVSPSCKIGSASISPWGKWESTLEVGRTFLSFPTRLALKQSGIGDPAWTRVLDPGRSRRRREAHLRASGTPGGRKMRRREAWRRQLVQRPAPVGLRGVSGSAAVSGLISLPRSRATINLG